MIVKDTFLTMVMTKINGFINFMELSFFAFPPRLPPSFTIFLQKIVSNFLVADTLTKFLAQ